MVCKIIPGCLTISLDRSDDFYILFSLQGYPSLSTRRASRAGVGRETLEAGSIFGAKWAKATRLGKPSDRKGRIQWIPGSQPTPTPAHSPPTINSSKSRIFTYSFNTSCCRLAPVGIQRALFHIPPGVGFCFDLANDNTKDPVPSIEHGKANPQGQDHKFTKGGRVVTKDPDYKKKKRKEKKSRVNGVHGCGLVQPWSSRNFWGLFVFIGGHGHWFWSSLSPGVAQCLSLYTATTTTATPNVLRFFGF